MKRYTISMMLMSGAVIGAPALAATQIEQGAVVTAAPPATRVQFEVFLPLRNPTDLQRLLTAQQTAGSPTYHKWVSPAEYAAQFGPTPDTMAKAQAAIQAAGLQVSTVRARSFQVSGTAAQVATLLGSSLKSVAAKDGTTRLVASGATLPAALTALGAHVIAFNGLVAKRPFATRAGAMAVPDNRYGPDGPYWYNDMKQAYDYPSYESTLPGGAKLDGTGVHAAVLMADLLFPNDVAGFFNHEHFTVTTGKPVPQVTTVPINGGGVVDGYGSFEASLDVQQILGGAPGSDVTLVSLPSLADDNIIDGYNYIVNSNKYDVVNSSFGGCELGYTAAYNGGTDYTYILQIYEDIFKQGNAQGITFVASSGDSGGLECPSLDYFNGGTKSRFIKAVSAPADSPSVTAVGGGNLVTTDLAPLRNSEYVGENAFGDPEDPYDVYGLGTNVSGGYWGAGGGRSVIFAKPSYQIPINTGSSFRTLPDVGMQVGGCPASAHQPCGPDRSAAITTYNGGNYGVIGTSVASPEFVGALALYIQKQGKRVGNINPYLYHFGQAQTQAGGVAARAASQYYHRNIKGFDGVWADDYPSQNYNYLNGNGTPDVRLLFGFSNFSAAGIPQTPSNP